MLSAELKTQLGAHLENIRFPIELVATLDDSPKSQELGQLLTELRDLSDKITLRHDGTASRRPSFEIRRTGTDIAVSFAAIPLGHELSSLLLALLQVGGHPPRIEDDEEAAAKAISDTLHFETYISLSCQNCPETVQALNILSILNPGITHETIDGALFQDEVEKNQIMSVPTVMLNGKEFAQGRLTIAEILKLLGADNADEKRARLDARDAFDVLVVGGGPAGAAAAIYAVRKGIDTGVLAERFGGQVLDTGAIENFISTAETQGPRLAAEMEAHVRSYPVDVVTGELASKLVPADQSASGLIEVELENGARLKTRSAILATGANWRQLGVPGEDEYRTRGVAYCPHCDGPLFKGKRVAVIGGGNSGVEAAIDLAGIVEHVTLIEFDAQLRADEVLVRKLQSFDNVVIITSAQTTEILGDGQKATGLRYKDRNSGDVHEIELAGVFIQIGLVPNTSWLKGTIDLTPHGEIIIDERGATSVAGVFAAGDATTVPYKQIIIAMGAGSTAALSAFDHLIRTSAPVASAAA